MNAGIVSESVFCQKLWPIRVSGQYATGNYRISLADLIVPLNLTSVFCIGFNTKLL